ncbi:hypothetical protein N7495_005725 [Penicillium taxi]|uniref:uncharacterized protein n=1 Tax=Penicillium taxi TaxID=168475 RepID=UPI0025458517|nr:uncharacterized protein N7495_005725 [Penicillium taxi]KAJ5894034.1 hypothetical protein N7495_005725 [Penicillium taxi]
MSNSEPYYSDLKAPPYILPPPPTVEERVAFLKHVLDLTDPIYGHRQEMNIQLVIELYENGAVTTDDDVWVSGGRRVTNYEECLATKQPSFHEVS